MISVVESAYGSVLYWEVNVAVPHISGGSTSDNGGKFRDMVLEVTGKIKDVGVFLVYSRADGHTRT